MKQRIIVGATALTLALAAFTGGADAAPKKAATPAPAKKPAATAPAAKKPVAAAPTASVPVNDATFVTQATYCTNLGIELGNMVLRQGISAHLREFAIKMVHDNTVLKDELKKIAAGAKFKQPGGIDPNMVEHRDHLAKMSGLAFDKAMWPVLLKGYSRGVDMFKYEAAHGQNKELVAWSKQRLPMMEAHLAYLKKETNAMAPKKATTEKAPEAKKPAAKKGHK